MQKDTPTETLETGAIPQGSFSGSAFDELVKQTHATFKERYELYGPALFETNSKGLSTIYRKAFPEDQQQHHNCTSCRHFFDRFGHMVFIMPDGNTIPAIWEKEVAPEEYRASVAAIEAKVRSNGVVRQFFTEHAQWGIPETEGVVNGAPVKWTHYYIPTEGYKLPIVDEGNVGEWQGKAEEATRLLTDAVDAYSLKVVTSAARLLEGEGKAGERYLKQTMWFHGVVKALEEDPTLKGTRRRSWLMLQAAKGTAINPSFPRIGVQVIGNILLEGIKRGQSTGRLLETFREKTDPETYRRQTAAPTAGSVEVAKKRFAELGLTEEDLLRRIASAEEVAHKFSWSPAVKVAPVKKGGLFDNIVTKDKVDDANLPDHKAAPVTMTWEKFKEKVLPKALAMKARSGDRNGQGNFFTLVAPVKEDAGQLFFYDDENDRNRFSHYTTNPMPHISHYGMKPGEFRDVVGIIKPPVSWTGMERGKEFDADILILSGMKENRTDVSLCLFNQLLRNDLYEVQRVISAFSEQGSMDISTENAAIGLRAGGVPVIVQVETELGWADYIIDRLE